MIQSDPAYAAESLLGDTYSSVFSVTRKSLRGEKKGEEVDVEEDSGRNLPGESGC